MPITISGKEAWRLGVRERQGMGKVGGKEDGGKKCNYISMF